MLRAETTRRHWATAVSQALLLAALVTGVPATASSQSPPETDVLEPFTVAYSVEWKGITAGVSTLTLIRLGGDDYRYDSTTVARGLARLLVADPVKQTSTFELVAGEVRPQQFRGIDEKERQTALDFNWQSNRVTGAARGNNVDLELKAGTQDPMSLQIAAMRQLQRGDLPTQIWMIDGNEIKDYEQRRHGSERIKTAIGELDTVVYDSKRPDGSRITRTWHAPSLGYLPVMAQRIRNGNVEVTMRIRNLQRAATTDAK